MNAEFNWWLLIVGLVVGAGLVWLVVGDWSRREDDLAQDERAAESAWIAQILLDRGEAVDPEAAEEILALHRVYLHQAAILESPAAPDDKADTEDFDAGEATDWPTDADEADVEEAHVEETHVEETHVEEADADAGAHRPTAAAEALDTDAERSGPADHPTYDSAVHRSV